MSLPLFRLQDPVFRGHDPGWSFAPASGEGARIHGGRFNRIGLAALYTSLRPETAWLEAQSGFTYKAQPLTLCQYDVDCAGMVDLTAEVNRRDLAIALADMGCAWELIVGDGGTPPSWTIADRLIGDGAAGMLTPSFAKGATANDVNAVFWRWDDSPPHQVKVVDEHGRLPKDRSSWT